MYEVSIYFHQTKNLWLVYCSQLFAGGTSMKTVRQYNLSPGLRTAAYVKPIEKIYYTHCECWIPVQTVMLIRQFTKVSDTLQSFNFNTQLIFCTNTTNVKSIYICWLWPSLHIVLALVTMQIISAYRLENERLF